VGHLGVEQLRRLGIACCILVFAACSSEPPVNPVQTAMSLTLAARPPGTATPLVTPTLDTQGAPTGKIAYVCQISTRSNYNQICLMNADGTNVRLLTSSSDYDNFYPSVSPDGASVLFSSNRSGTYEIYEIELASNELTQLTNLGNRRSYSPAVSPDGAWIVFTVESSGGGTQATQLWLMSRDGSNPAPLTSLNGGAWDPSWSPDGTRIMFASSVNARAQLIIMNADGSDQRQVTDMTGLRGRNDWSADGLSISTYVGPPWERDIYLFNADGSNPRRLTFGGNNLAPSFSPDGVWIAFTSYRDNPREDLGCEIYIMRVDGTDARRLTDNEICDWQPRWGP
jgi:TolB protein